MSAQPYTIKTLAQRWQVSAQTVGNMLRDGRLEGFKLGKRAWRISAETVRAYERGKQWQTSDSESSMGNSLPSTTTTDSAIVSGLALRWTLWVLLCGWSHGMRV